MATHFKVSGTVQGVGFRWHAKRAADRLGVTGWVRNCADGSVEGVVAGSAAGVEELLSVVKRGPSAAYVRNFETSEVDDDGGSDFEIRR